MTSTREHAANLDQLAALDEERQFLLRSLHDLDREHDAGDVSDADYLTLKDGYTARAADVLRRLAEGEAQLPARPPRDWRRASLVTAIVLALAVGVGFALAAAWGERGAGQEITGFTPGDDARTVLASARSTLNSGEINTETIQVANSLFARVVEMERERGVENAEAIAYFGWTLALLSRAEPDAARGSQLLDAAKLSLAQAIEIDAAYADPYCYLAIVEFQFDGDADAALPYIEVCESSDPPKDVADIVVAFADEIRAAANP